MKTISPARLAAAQTLMIIETEPFAQSGDVLAQKVTLGALRGDDARLARTIVFGVLRHSLTLDFYYQHLLKQPSSKLDSRLRMLLRMALFQRHFLSKVPDYAIVNDTVELAKSIFRLKPQQVGFLNAVLRQIVAADALPALPEGQRVGHFSTRYSFPREVAGMLVEKYGTHKSAAIMELSNQEPPMTLRINSLRTSRAELTGLLQSDGFTVQDGVLAPQALLVETSSEGKSLFETQAFNDGLFYVQDEASQLVAQIVAPQAGESILDFCSAPGGKATHLAELSGAKAQITATDLSPERLEHVLENVARLHTPGVQVAQLDEVMGRGQLFDAVLVDAPCSGLGTMRRNPEIRYRMSDEGFERQRVRQLNVLHEAAPLVREGGRLVYSTCSISDQENKGTIAQFLKDNNKWEIAGKPVETATAEVSEVGVDLENLRRPDGFYATWPRYPQVDGFEAVVLRRL